MDGTQSRRHEFTTSSEWLGANKGADDGRGERTRVGSEEHKALFCRMLIDTYNPYNPESIDWPLLCGAELQRLHDLPIWAIALETENRARLNVASYAEMIDDPQLRQAIMLNAFEEGRHKKVLAAMVRAYEIALPEASPTPAPRFPEWAFMVTGLSECIDSFFAFGLFEAAKRSGFFPAALVDAFEPIMQEECRHILFFVNWAAWHRRNLSWWRRPIFGGKFVAVWAFLLWERLRTARDVGRGQNFTASGRVSIGVDLSVIKLLDLCLAENERRLGRYDDRLVRPTTVPWLARLILRFAEAFRWPSVPSHQQR